MQTGIKVYGDEIDFDIVLNYLFEKDIKVDAISIVNGGFMGRPMAYIIIEGEAPKTMLTDLKPYLTSNDKELLQLYKQNLDSGIWKEKMYYTERSRVGITIDFKIINNKK